MVILLLGIGNPGYLVPTVQRINYRCTVNYVRNCIGIPSGREIKNIVSYINHVKFQNWICDILVYVI